MISVMEIEFGTTTNAYVSSIDLAWISNVIYIADANCIVHNYCIDHLLSLLNNIYIYIYSLAGANGGMYISALKLCSLDRDFVSF